MVKTAAQNRAGRTDNVTDLCAFWREGRWWWWDGCVSSQKPCFLPYSPARKKWLQWASGGSSVVPKKGTLITDYFNSYLVCTTGQFSHLLRMVKIHLDGSTYNPRQVFLMFAFQSTTQQWLTISENSHCDINQFNSSYWTAISFYPEEEGLQQKMTVWSLFCNLKRNTLDFLNVRTRGVISQVENGLHRSFCSFHRS